MAPASWHIRHSTHSSLGSHLLHVVDRDEKHSSIFVPQQHCAWYLGIKAQLQGRHQNKHCAEQKQRPSHPIGHPIGRMVPWAGVGVTDSDGPQTHRRHTQPPLVLRLGCLHHKQLHPHFHLTEVPDFDAPTFTRLPPRMRAWGIVCKGARTLQRDATSRQMLTSTGSPSRDNSMTCPSYERLNPASSRSASAEAGQILLELSSIHVSCCMCTLSSLGVLPSTQPATQLAGTLKELQSCRPFADAPCSAQLHKMLLL